jgi:hypothetical protein
MPPRVRPQSKRQKIIAMLAVGRPRGEIINQLDVSASYVRKTVWDLKQTAKSVAKSNEQG